MVAIGMMTSPCVSPFRIFFKPSWHIGSFASAEEFLLSGLQAEAACLISDIRMPDMTGLSYRKDWQQRVAGYQ